MLQSKYLSDADIRDLTKEWEAMDPDSYDGPEVVMTSIGLVDLWLDGEITGYGRIIYTLE
jgi:hypothetical protein